MSIANLARAEIRALRPYEAALQLDDTIKLNANEAPWTSSVESFRRPLNRYPEIRPIALRSALSQRYGCNSENLIVTRGTSEAIDLLLRVFCRAGRDNVVTTTPSFSMYRHYANVQGAEMREIETMRDDNFAVDPDAIVEACDATTKLIFLCSPNNPTGTALAPATLLQILQKRGSGSAVVVDEAYIEFSAQSSATKLLQEYDNLIILRTLSKALAFAGARCGAVIAPRDVIDMLDAVQAPYALATPVVECVENALQDENLHATNRCIKDIISERERMLGSLREFSFVRKVWPSAANFLLVELDATEKLMQQCSSDKLLLRFFGKPLADCVRITVGTPIENEYLLATLARVGG